MPTVAQLRHEREAVTEERLRQEFAAANAPVQVIEAAGPGQATMSGKRWKLVGIGSRPCANMPLADMLSPWQKTQFR